MNSGARTRSSLFVAMFGPVAFLRQPEWPNRSTNCSAAARQVLGIAGRGEPIKSRLRCSVSQPCDAIAKADPQRQRILSDAYLAEVREAALILLYRLLFILYAEDRNLLPEEIGPYADFCL